MLIGHGVGAWWHQQEPILRRKSELVLEEGMVLALEPHVNFWHVQDMILVTRRRADAAVAEVQYRRAFRRALKPCSAL